MCVLAHSHMFEIFCIDGNFGGWKLLGMWTIIMLFNIKQGILAEEILANLW